MPLAADSRSGVVRIAFEPHEIAHMQSIVDAVCLELGVTTREKARRQAVAERVRAAYERGCNLPLNMVSAGLAEKSAGGHHA